MVSSQRMTSKTLFVFVLALIIAILPIDEQTSFSASPKGCKQCHDVFTPFEVVAKAPKTFVPGEETVLECLVYNNGQHSVKDLVAEIAGLGTGSGVNVKEEDFSGSVSRVSGSAHSFKVEDGASGLVIQMSEDPGSLGQGDARLSLKAPNGESYSSNSGGSEEKITLDSNGTKSAGPGTFGISIDQVDGVRPVSYTIKVQTEYRNLELVIILDNLGPGDKTSGRWNLSLTEEELKGLKVSVTGTVYQSHDDGEQEEEYTIERSFAIGSSTGEAATFEIKPYRNGLGYVLIGFMVASLFTGLPWTRNLIPGLKGKVVLKVHCIISWLMVTIIAIHAYLASLTHPYTSPAVITGEGMTVVFLVLTLIPTVDWMNKGFRQGILERIGRGRYMMVNRVVIVVTLVVLGIHIYS